MRSKKIEALKLKLKLSDQQREVLVGLLLGDACLETQNGGKTYRLKIEQSEKHQDYLQHLYDLFAEWVLTQPRKRQVHSGDFVSVNLAFQTVSHSAFRFYAQNFYGNQKKTVPKLIGHWLTPKALAYWYMDDGSMKSKDSKGVIFNTQGFTKNEVNLLSKVLGHKYGLSAKLRKQKDGHQIYISGSSYEDFIQIVKPHVIPSMLYKIQKARQTQLPKE